MMFAAVETLAKSNPAWESQHQNTDVTAKATAR